MLRPEEHSLLIAMMRLYEHTRTYQHTFQRIPGESSLSNPLYDDTLETYVTHLYRFFPAREEKIDLFRHPRCCRQLLVRQAVPIISCTHTVDTRRFQGRDSYRRSILLLQVSPEEKNVFKQINFTRRISE